MRCTVYRPQGRRSLSLYLLLISEFSNKTSPIARSAAMDAGHGFCGYRFQKFFMSLIQLYRSWATMTRGKDKAISEQNSTKTLEAHGPATLCDD